MYIRSQIEIPSEKRQHQGEIGGTGGRTFHREIGGTGGRTFHIAVQESKPEVVWIREETRPRIWRKEDAGDSNGTTWEKNEDCVKRDMRAIGTTNCEVHDGTGWRIIVSAAATSCDNRISYS